VTGLVNVAVEDVRDVLNVDSSDIADEKIEKMIKRASVALGLELSVEIDYLLCSEAQKEAITLLAAIYAVCFLTGGSAIGLNFTVGDLSNSISNLPCLTVLQVEFEKVLGNLKEPYVGAV
jgi:hypothetical protein